MDWSQARRALAVLATTATIGVAGSAHAQDFEEGGQLYAVQNRKYVAQHEFALSVGVVPNDAFYKGFTGTFAYTFHFNDFWAWEIGSFTYSLNLNTSLRDELEKNFGVRPTKFPELQLFAGSNLVLKPLYGKMAWLNDSLVYGELYLTIGPAVSNWVNAGVFVGLNAGLGLRLYLTRAFSVKLEVRDYEYILASTFQDTQNVLFLQVGIALNIH